MNEHMVTMVSSRNHTRGSLDPEPVSHTPAVKKQEFIWHLAAASSRVFWGTASANSSANTPIRFSPRWLSLPPTCSVFP